MREPCKVLEKCFTKENYEDMRASGTSPEKDKVFVAMQDIVKKFDEALFFRKETVSGQKKRRLEEALKAE